MTAKKKQLIELLKIHFNYDNFRSGQEKAIDSILEKKDTVVVLPTGGGKSMIYQLPALVLDGVTLVVSPLIALMKDQVDSLDSVGIPATFINSSLNPKEIDNRLSKMKQGYYRLIYIAPERFYNHSFMQELSKIKVALFAIDEAHCISQWGHDFRPSYLRLKEVIKQVHNPPVLALTATATIEVRQDIIKQLDLKHVDLIVSGFSRPNLHFAAVLASGGQKVSKILDLFKDSDLGSGIIYVGTRSKAEEIVSYLNEHNIKAVEYHAGLDNDSRSWVQEQFMKNEAQVVVATNAFGLGINKKDIRFVIHYDLPGTIEAYYQEAGRAGRDGKDSFCLLFYSPSDRYLQEFFIQGDNPGEETIMNVYRVLLEMDEKKDYQQNSLLFTYSEIIRSLETSVPEMAIGTCLKILEKENYISRPNERKANAYLKRNISLNVVRNSIGSRAKNQKKILDIIEEKLDEKISQGWQFSLDEAAVIFKMEKNSFLRAVKSLAEKNLLEFRPPFRGTEIKITKRVEPEEILPDLEKLKDKAKRAYEKLDNMENYVYSNKCRQVYILNYFGEDNNKACGVCDNCLNKNNNVEEDNNSFEFLGNY